MVCGSKYPTISQEIPSYILLIKHIDQAHHRYDVAPIVPEVTAMISKLPKYLTKLATFFEDDATKHFQSTHPLQVNVTIEKSNCIFDQMYPSTLPEHNTLEVKIQSYLMEPPEPKDTDIALFWKSCGTAFPTLVIMAQEYLGIPATSTPSERVFSGERKILTYQRSHLSSMHIEQLACVKDWSSGFAPIYSYH
ncbi:hypothetical protein O181_003639 [Austropuccinia psidii MF-1]|uniref:HAT C-terminal dimerisation domain-containing protein n=1 Tax=Austropuccinia psidii MF-1 TaxID=1389203 RepID=A0A9Q3BEQ6_9BASI|nr:hypothetical protein [Austropuccinia psidii MF-1]